MIKNLINKYKRLRNFHLISNNYTEQYAFVGIGNHALSNLYPIIQYLQVPLKYICCRTESKTKTIEKHFNGVKATNSLDEILVDDSIKGVFVATTPSAHYSIAEQIIKSGKALFIEKPPCSTLQELNTLITIGQQNIISIGLQKRYAPCIKMLRKRLEKEYLISYSLRYLTGTYPEGNALLDLFIHPLDLVAFLFGEASILNCNAIHRNNDLTLFLTLKHHKIIGTLELSTHYSWNNALESLSVNTDTGIYSMDQMDNLIFTHKSTLLCGIPMDKIRHSALSVEYLYNRNNFSPIIANNQIVSQGFFDEIKSFVDAVEKKDNACILSDIKSIRNTYSLLDQISDKILLGSR